MTAATEAVRVLLVEDDEDDYLITLDMLAAQERMRVDVEWCRDYDGALAAIREVRHDVYLIDYRLGAHTGLELVRAGFSPQVPAAVLILTGQSDYAIDLEATALGVTDYLIKQELNPVSLERSIRYAVSQRKALRDLIGSEERYALAVNAANDGIWDWDLAADRIYLSPRWHAILGDGAASGETDPATWFQLVHPDDLDRLRTEIDDHLKRRTAHLLCEHRMLHADGSWRWVLTRGLARHSEAGVATRMAGSLADITERRVAQRQLEHDALHDALTRLPNRALFMDRVDQLRQRAGRDPSIGYAVLFLDVDRFKLVNDSLSHATGDLLLVALADRLVRILRPGDSVARIGGDEFTILLDETASAEAAELAAGRIQATLSEPFWIDGHELFVTASIGIALSGPGITPSELVRNADIAMYQAKRGAASRCAVFDESMHLRVIDRLTRQNELRHAIEESLLRVHYQPIVELASGRIVGVEALVRWPEGWPHVTPLEFIPIAEETGMISRLGMHVMRTALGTLADWRRAGIVDDAVRVSVNLSARQLDDPGLPAQIRAALREADLPADALRIELTESTLMREPERMGRIVSALCSIGIAVHLDDFGTGYSSLGALHQLPVEALKIDRSFISAEGPDRVSGDVIVRSTIALAHSLRLHVVAEGIETRAQLTHLQELGCEYGQGYLLSRPLCAEDARALLAHWQPAAVAA